LRDEAGYYVMGCGKFLDKFYGKRGPEGKHRIQEFGYSDGIRNRGKWASAGTVENDRDHVYRCYLLERDLLETHKKDFALRSGTHRDHFAATFPTPLPDEAYCDSWLAQNGLDLIESAPEDRPWHLMVSFIGPHDPLDVTHEMYEWYREDKAVDFPGPAPLGADDGFDGRTHNEIRRNYSAIVENIDHWVGRYLDRLRERDELENTLIVFSSDHGEMLGDHGQWKKHSPYQASAGVPMVVAGPGVEPRGRCEEPVTVLDAHATFLDYAGVTPGDIDSRSLRPFLTGETDAHREVVHSGLGPWRMVYDGRYKLISGYDPDDDNVDQVGEFVELDDEKQQMLLEERNDILFDLRTDPNETQNIIGDRPDIADELSEHLSSVAPS
jgi:arylsulfatase A-like enzyme